MTKTYVFDNICRYYLDGAHTNESISVCANWFKSSTKHSTGSKVLIFNATGERSSDRMLDVLRTCEFAQVFFVPNRAFQEDREGEAFFFLSLALPTGNMRVLDMRNFNILENQQLQRCHDHYEIWKELETTNTYNSAGCVKVFPSVSCALDYLSPDAKYDVLVTGSLHLVGAALSVIDPELKTSYSDP